MIASPHAVRPPIGAVIVGVAVGTILVGGGLFLAWLAFATPIISGLAPTTLRPGISQVATGILVWGVTLVAPPAFAIVGVLRLGRVARALSVKPRTRALSRAAADLGDEYVAAAGLRLPDGRVIRDVVLGPFGLAVITELPPARMTRHTGSIWEARRTDGRWIPMENPLDRATRDAERMRRWAGSNDRDWVVKVFAVAVTDDPGVTRTATCAVVTADQIPGWLASLPPARGLTPDRRTELLEQLAALA